MEMNANTKELDSNQIEYSLNLNKDTPSTSPRSKTGIKVKRCKGAPKIVKTRVKSESGSGKNPGSIRSIPSPRTLSPGMDLTDYLDYYGLGPELPKFKICEDLVVQVIEAHNPSLFWVHPTKYSEQLTQLMHNIR
jgi:hypothetical protein